jgi:hypothetical protein
LLGRSGLPTQRKDFLIAEPILIQQSFERAETIEKGNHANLAREANEGLSLLPLEFLRLVLGFQFRIIGITEHNVFALAIKARRSRDICHKPAL